MVELRRWVAPDPGNGLRTGKIGMRGGAGSGFKKLFLSVLQKRLVKVFTQIEPIVILCESNKQTTNTGTKR
jgi:hypothetical protein